MASTPPPSVTSSSSTEGNKKKKKEGPKVKKILHTNRSRLYSAIAKIAKEKIGETKRGKAPISRTAIGLLEDVCTYMIKRVCDDCSRMLEKRATVSLEVVRSALRLSIRNPDLYDHINNAAMTVVHTYRKNVEEGNKGEKMSISPNRVGRLMRRSIPGRKQRLSFESAVYMAGALQSLVTIYIEKVDSGKYVSKERRLGVNDFYIETRENLDLNSIVPFSMIIRFNADKHYMPRKRSRTVRTEEEEEVPKPPKKKKKRAEPPDVVAKRRRKTRKHKKLKFVEVKM